MRINFPKISYNQPSERNFSFRKYSAPISDTFELKNKNIGFCAKRRNKKNPLNGEDDYTLYKVTPRTLRKYRYSKLPNNIIGAAEDSIMAANIIKGDLDKKYGRHNYVFVSIGTSPAGVAKAMEYMGEDVRYVPISDLGRIGFSYRDLTEYQDYDRYSSFLDSIGLDRKSVIKSGKKHIFYDYTSTGRTLSAVKYYAERRNIPDKCMEFRSLDDELARYALDNPECAFDVLRYNDYYLQKSHISTYSGIPHLNCMLVNDIDEVLAAPKSQRAKDFDFAILYTLDKLGKLKK